MKPTFGKLARFVRDKDYRGYVISTNWERWHKRGFGESEAEQIAQPPATVVLIVTDDCNLRCPMCPVSSHDKNYKRLDMPVDLATKVLQEIRAWKPLVVLCGGEPMIYPHWQEVVKTASDWDIRTNITTNGVLLPRHVNDILDSGLSELAVSLDGIGPLHDEIRGRSGLFDKAVKAIRDIVALRDSRGLDCPQVSLCFTISERNYHQMLEFAEYAKRQLPELVCLNYLHLVFSNPEELQRHNRAFRKALKQETPDIYRMMIESQNIDRDVFLSQMKALKERQWPFEVAFRPDHPPEEIGDYYLNPNYRRNALIECRAPWEAITVLPHGFVTPCLSYLAGNVREESLLDIWNNDKMRKFRSALARNGRFPLCHRCCY